MQQFEAGLTTDASHHDRFWVAVYTLGIDEEDGVITVGNLLDPDRDAPAPTTKSRSAETRSLASLRTVRRKWGHAFHHYLSSRGLILPTNPSVHLAANLAKLARKHRLDDASRLLRLAMKPNRPGQTTSGRNMAGDECVNNADVESALAWVDTPHARAQSDGGPEHSPRAHKSRRAKSTLPRLPPPSPKRPRRSDTPGSSRSTSTPLSEDGVDEVPETPAPFLHRLSLDAAAIDPSLGSPTTPRAGADTTTNQETGDEEMLEEVDEALLDTCNAASLNTGEEAMLDTADAVTLDTVSDVISTNTPSTLLVQTPSPHMRATGEPTEFATNTKPFEEIWQEMWRKMHAAYNASSEVAYKATSEAAYKATSEAQKALVPAQTKLAQIQAQIDAIHFPLRQRPPDRDSEWTPMKRLDGTIKVLEVAESRLEPLFTAYTDVVTPMKPYEGLYDVPPVDPQVFQSQLQRIKEAMSQYKQLRVGLAKAAAEEQELRAKYALAKRKYTNLWATWDRMQSQSHNRPPPDEEPNTGSTQEIFPY
ncbi:hypothetical protein FB567DRAFT_539308 [Paraphoma chrysanthemicola]|uniref:Uncharacterized protein n=1 Tax=Paraphoma chrysanthemicola TaxID=798071 RepID=A0A8K0QVV1_9PLEO|nr:hypothetical protein FB567DRAFT_539308 [Paraphoma chrysanthemicola]